jgi:VWFA-related protein
MKRHWATLGGSLGVIASLAFGPQAPAPVPAGYPDAIFRTTSRLVQVGVIAEDKEGRPVADLRRDEFQIFDNGSAENIQLFLAETEKPKLAAPQARPPNMFTNRIDGPMGSAGGYSVILIDNLFTIFGDPDKEPGGSAVARLQALRVVHSLQPDEKVAIYAEGRKLKVICEFTADRDLLERQLAAWTPNVDTPDVTIRAMADPRDQYTADATSKVVAEAVRIDGLQRASANDEEMGLLADHLAGVPGRKNLIWLSTRFVIGASAIRKFGEANVAVYPVDVDGVCGGPDDSLVPCPVMPKEWMDRIAAQTGGLAFYGRNDLDTAMRTAMHDGRVSYMLGFYQPGEEKKATVHRIGVRTSHAGVQLRYRTTYQTGVQGPGSSSRAADLAHAMNRPVDATAIPISVSAVVGRGRLDLKVSLDIASLGLELSDGLWKGKVELAAGFVAADGAQAGEVLSKTISFHLRPVTYSSLLQSGVRDHEEMNIPSKAVSLKVLVADLASGRIGTLTIPLSRLESGAPTER